MLFFFFKARMASVWSLMIIITLTECLLSQSTMALHILHSENKSFIFGPYIFGEASFTSCTFFKNSEIDQATNLWEDNSLLLAAKTNQNTQTPPFLHKTVQRKSRVVPHDNMSVDFQSSVDYRAVDIQEDHFSAMNKTGTKKFGTFFPNMELKFFDQHKNESQDMWEYIKKLRAPPRPVVGAQHPAQIRKGTCGNQSILEAIYLPVDPCFFTPNAEVVQGKAVILDVAFAFRDGHLCSLQSITRKIQNAGGDAVLFLKSPYMTPFYENQETKEEAQVNVAVLYVSYTFLMDVLLLIRNKGRCEILMDIEGFSGYLEEKQTEMSRTFFSITVGFSSMVTIFCALRMLLGTLEYITDLIGRMTRKRQFKNLLVTTYNTLREKQPDVENSSYDLCAICRDDFGDTDQVTGLKCNHLYHTECIRSWVLVSSKCPVCKQDVYG